MQTGIVFSVPLLLAIGYCVAAGMRVRDILLMIAILALGYSAVAGAFLLG